MVRSLIVRRRATDDLVRTVRQIAEQVSYASAVRWKLGIDATIRDLALTADHWPEADEAEELGLPLKCRLFGRRRHVYRILYTVDVNQVTVHRIRHSAQDRLVEGDL